MENNNEECEAYEIKIGDETCLVNRNQKTFQRLSKFEDLHPHYNAEYGLHCKTDNGTIYPLNKCVIGCTNVPTKYSSDEEYYTSLCEIKSKHVDSIIRNVYKMGIQSPSIIQTMGLLPLINGQDTIIQFKSGTGKTFTFLIGLLWGFDVSNVSLQYVFLTSSHQVATQIYDLVKKLVPTANVSLCIGGNRQQAGGFRQNNNGQNSISALRKELKCAQIIVGTVGKTYELICLGTMIPSLSNVRAICMDEFDLLVTPQKARNSSYEERTENHIENILKRIPKYAQRVFFSATVIPDSDQIARSYFRPYDKDVGEPFMLMLHENNFIVNGIRHYFVVFDSNDSKCDALVELWGRMRNGGQCIIFVNRTDTARKLQEYLEKKLPHVVFNLIYGGMDGSSRARIFQDFQSGACRYLIATDVFARGIDVQSVNFVINFDMPDKMETYIHRVGRAGRYGRKGIAMNFVLQNREIDEMLKVDEINLRGEMNKMEPLPENIEDLL